jgi:hypothetical protein
MAEPPSADGSSRHQLFETARRHADWRLEQLWMSYMSLGGSLVIFDLDAYLAGLMPMPPGQQDVLACALNERLADLHQTLQIPDVSANGPDQDALTELLGQLADEPDTPG